MGGVTLLSHDCSMFSHSLMFFNATDIDGEPHEGAFQIWCKETRPLISQHFILECFRVSDLKLEIDVLRNAHHALFSTHSLWHIA